MSDWRLAKSLETLREQVDKLWPHRSKASDGTIGDARHQAEASDHNPNSHGVVTAIDITQDPAHGADMHVLSERLRRAKDKRIAYMIFNHRICDGPGKSGTGGGGVDPWTWRPYTGSDPHTNHLHLSVVGDPKLYDNEVRWDVGPVKAPAPKPAPKPPAPVSHRRPPHWFRLWLRRYLLRWFR